MSDWKGFDSGGTEQLWEPDILRDMLAVMKSHEPFSRTDDQSPIFDDLESLHPEITWRNINADGSFRPIFRKANPLVKLGLTDSETVNACVTPLGDEVLAGVSSIQDVYISAAKSHQESDGKLSMALMCAAALELPAHIFTIEDVEFGISEQYDPIKRNAAIVINAARSSGATIPSGASTRVRRLRDFMNALVFTGAFKQVNGGWSLDDVSVATDIAFSLGATIQPAPTGTVKTPASVKKRTATPVSTSVKQINPGNRQKITITPNLITSGDPVKRALLLERANNIHEELVSEIANLILSVGETPLEDVNSFDVAIHGQNEALIEVKTITKNNCTSQLRKAIAQLPEYRWRHKEQFTNSVKQIIALSEDPSPFVEPDYLEYVITDRGLKVVWKHNGEFIDSTGRSLKEILFPSL